MCPRNLINYLLIINLTRYIDPIAYLDLRDTWSFGLARYVISFYFSPIRTLTSKYQKKYEKKSQRRIWKAFSLAWSIESG